MGESKKKFSESAKKVIEIRRVLCDNSNNKLAEKLGLSPQTVSNLTAGLRGIGRGTAEKIIAAFPEISRVWLLTGEGPMLVSDGDNNNTIQVTNNSTNHGSITTIDDRLIAIIEGDREKHHEERMELLAIIRNLTEPKQ